jgi:hypothetical protein
MNYIIPPSENFDRKYLTELHHNSRLILVDDVAKNTTGLVGIVSNPVRVGGLRRQPITVNFLEDKEKIPLLSGIDQTFFDISYLFQGVDIGFVEESRTFENKFNEIIRGVYDKNRESIVCFYDVPKTRSQRVSGMKSVYPLYTKEGWKLLEQYQEEQRVIREEAAMMMVPPF